MTKGGENCRGCSSPHPWSWGARCVCGGEHGESCVCCEAPTNQPCFFLLAMAEMEMKEKEMINQTGEMIKLFVRWTMKKEEELRIFRAQWKGILQDYRCAHPTDLGKIFLASSYLVRFPKWISQEYMTTAEAKTKSEDACKRNVRSKTLDILV
jgi:hypothetical protein